MNFIENGLAPSGPLAGDGNFLALKLTATDWNDYDSVVVGLEPSEGTGLVEITTDPDKNCVGKIASTAQKFVVVAKRGILEVRSEYPLTGLTLNES